jgi:Ca-activated chloride channel family protein
MRYQERSGLGALSSGTSKPKTQSPELLFVNLRYKPPTDTVSKLMQRAVVDSNLAPCSEFRFQLAVAGYAMLLRDSEFKGKLTFDDVITLAKNATGDDKDRLGFVSMVEATRRIASGVAKRD